MLLAAAGLAGCPPRQADGPDAGPLPTIHDLAPATQPGPAVEAGHAPAAPLARLVRITLPLDRDVSPAWALTRTKGLDPLMVAAWRESGLRIATLDADQADAFSQALGQVVSLQSDRMSAPEHLDVLYASPRLPGTVDLFVADPGRFSPPVRITGGQCRLLARFAGLADDGMEVLLVPQHYKARLTLEPRQPWEKLLDGTLFDRLSLRADLYPGRLIVIAMDQPLPEPPAVPQPEAPAATQPGDPAATQPVEVPLITPAPDDPARIPDHLGKWLLGAMRVGKPVQTVLVISRSEPGM